MEQIMEEYGIGIVLVLIGVAAVKALASIFNIF